MRATVPVLSVLLVGCAGSTANRDGGVCASAVECPEGQVCDMEAGLCSGRVECTDHADCGPAAHCGEDNLCAPSDLGSPCGDDIHCLPRDTCMGGYCGCVGEDYSAQNAPPNVLILLDRSGSMNSVISNSTKWLIAQDAIAALLAEYGDVIRFGLALYPGSNQDCSEGAFCTPGMVAINPAEPPDSTVAAISEYLAEANTCSFGTPTAETLTALLDYSGLEDSDRANYILLITDGESTCEDPVPVVTALRNETPEVKTFAIGFGEGVGARELNDMAREGGTEIAGGPPYYYVADDLASLDAALDEIAGTVFYCTYTLSEEPDDLNELYVYQNEVLIERDTTHQNGWDYDAATNQLTFYGPACDALQNGEVEDLVIVYGCPIVVP